MRISDWSSDVCSSDLGAAGAKPGNNADKKAGVDSSEASPTGDDADADTRTASEDEETLSFHGEPWDPVTNPLTVSLWPDFTNSWLNAQVARGKKNIQRQPTAHEALQNGILISQHARPVHQ